MPLVFNSVAALATVLLLSHLLVLHPICTDETKNIYVLAASACGLVLVSNLVGLVFTGMEHSLQVLMAVAILAGLFAEVRDGKPTRLLLAAIVFAPLVRYENLAIAIPALIYLALRGHWRGAAVSGGLLAVMLISFSGFLLANDHAFVPNSVLAKSVVIRDGGSLASLFEHALENLEEGQARFLGFGVVAFMAIAFSIRVPVRVRLLAASVTASILLHLAVGRFGWYHRYEIYIYLYAVIAALYLFKSTLAELIDRQSRWKTTILIVASTAALSIHYVDDLRTIPKACRNVYLQQYQMARFVSEFYDKPVAVNDLGLVGLESSAYVLDLWGIGSKEALDHRVSDRGSRWISDLTSAHAVELAMVYDVVWSKKLPRHWKRVGTLSFQDEIITVSGRHVAFYAVQPLQHADIAERMVPFVATLPEGATFAFHRAAR
jgi:hypothetical protein